MTEFSSPRLLIDGQLRTAENGRTFPNIDPYQETDIGPVPEASVDDVHAAATAAQRAFAETTWSKDHAFRARCIRQLREALQKHREELIELLVAEAGCPVFMTNAIQFDLPVDFMSASAELAESYEFEYYLDPVTLTTPESQRLVIKEPWGVAALITPYNYPMQQLVSKLGMALAAGNTVIAKPSPMTSASTCLAGKIATEETDLPPGVFNVITSSAPEVSEALVAHPDVQMVHFTGSTAVGKRIMATCADQVKKVALELGGKSASLVLEDADYESVVRFNVPRMARHSGQGCSNLTRLLLPRKHYEHGLEIAAEMAPQVLWGDPRNPETHMGPQISGQHQGRVLQYIEKGIAEGGRLVVGGGVPADRKTGYFVEATVIADVDPKDTIAQEEIFGPVLAVIPYDTEEEAIRIANDSIYGLNGAVWSSDDAHALDVAKQIRTGAMEVNGATWYWKDSPFGGMKQSGLGREWGRIGLEEFLDVRVLGHYPIGRGDTA